VCELSVEGLWGFIRSVRFRYRSDVTARRSSEAGLGDGGFGDVCESGEVSGGFGLCFFMLTTRSAPVFGKRQQM
jgi:hypothetical protein